MPGKHPLLLSLHPPAWVRAVAIVEDVGRPVTRLRGRTARHVVGGRLRARPAGVAVEEDVVAAVVVALIAVLPRRLQLVLLVERLWPDPVAAGVAGRRPLLQRDRRGGVPDLRVRRRVVVDPELHVGEDRKEDGGKDSN